MHLEKSKSGVKNLPNKTITNVDISSTIEKNRINLDNQQRFSKNYNDLENQSKFNSIKHNKSESFLRKENKERTMVKYASKNYISKEKILINLNGIKENDPADKRHENIKNVTNSNININFVKVHLPLILPNLPANTNLNTNSNVFRNNKIQKRKSTKKNSLVK